MARNFKKEMEWERSAYKRYFFKARIDNGEFDNLNSILDGCSFAEWVRQHLQSDIAERDRINSEPTEQ